MSGSPAARYQREVLAKVSRTFALTIPRLPAALRGVVTNAYLLCRIADTIEDEPALPRAAKEYFHARFVQVVNGTDSAETFARELAPRIEASAAERDLVQHTPLVLQMTRSYGARQRAALERCIAIMCEGMPRFQRAASLDGLADLAAMRAYCDVVAGVVGETLTELFCAHAPEIARDRERLLQLGVSFGRGLQMTNILKDFWEDHDRGVCWLPRDLFARHGARLGGITRERRPACFGAVYAELIAVAHGHLCDAREYTLLLPPRETGIRGFCAIALGLALATLHCIHARRDFTAASEVKVSRQVVASTVVAARRFASNDAALRRWLERLAEGLPAPRAAGDPAPAAATPAGNRHSRDGERAKALGA